MLTFLDRQADPAELNHTLVISDARDQCVKHSPDTSEDILFSQAAPAGYVPIVCDNHSPYVAEGDVAFVSYAEACMAVESSVMHEDVRAGL